MTNEDVYTRLEVIIEKYKLATRDSLELETKNCKKLYKSVLNLMDEMQQDKPNEELFDDDEWLGQDSDEEDMLETCELSDDGEVVEKSKPKFTMDDILGDDDDEIW
jgi:hypothetical protein